MGRNCCVKNCESAESRCINGETVSFFAVPKNPETRAKWLSFLQANGAKKFRKTAWVCEKHFTPGKVIKEFKWVDTDGNVLLQRKFGRASLVSGAIPTVFSSTPSNNNIVQQSVLKSLPHTRTIITERNKQGEPQPTLTMSCNTEPVEKTVTPVTISNCTEETSNDSSKQKPRKSERIQTQALHRSQLRLSYAREELKTFRKKRLKRVS